MISVHDLVKQLISSMLFAFIIM